MFGSKNCRRMKRVRGKNGKYVMRCAEFSGGNLGSLGKLPFDLDALKGTLLTGVVAVGGAVLAAKGVGYLAPMLNIQPGSMWLMVLEVAIGLVAGFAIGKYTNKADIGAAVAVGPVVVNGLKLVGMYLAPAASSPIAGHFAGNAPVNTQNSLGVTVPGGYFPEWAYQNDYLTQVGKQVPAWNGAA